MEGGSRPNAVSISTSDVINNDVILRSEGGGGQNRLKIAVILKESPLMSLDILWHCHEILQSVS